MDKKNLCIGNETKRTNTVYSAFLQCAPQHSPHLRFPLVTPCFWHNADQCISISFTTLLFSLRLTLCGAQSELKTEENLVLGFVVQLYSRKWQPLSSVTRTLSYIREKTLTDLWHFPIIFSYERGSGQGFTLQCQTHPPLTRQDTYQWSWQRPFVHLRPLDVPQPERESTTRREANQMKKAHVTHQVRGERERKRELSFSYEKVFFFYKSFFLTSPPLLTSGMFHI